MFYLFPFHCTPHSWQQQAAYVCAHVRKGKNAAAVGRVSCFFVFSLLRNSQEEVGGQ